MWQHTRSLDLKGWCSGKQTAASHLHSEKKCFRILKSKLFLKRKLWCYSHIKREKQYVCLSYLWLPVICWCFVSPVLNGLERLPWLSGDFLIGLCLFYFVTQSLEKKRGKAGRGVTLQLQTMFSNGTILRSNYSLTVSFLGLFFFKFFYLLNNAFFSHLLLLNLWYYFRKCMFFLFQWCILQLQIWEINQQLCT